jgi:hypothetical protein
MKERIMSDTVQQHVADVAAAVSTSAVATYHFTDFLEQGALVVAIISGGLAAAWHVYRFYREYKDRKGGNYASTKNIQSGSTPKRTPKA